MIDKQNHFEGDILLEDSKMMPRAGRLENKMWPDKTIPYTISDKYGMVIMHLYLPILIITNTNFFSDSKTKKQLISFWRQLNRFKAKLVLNSSNVQLKRLTSTSTVAMGNKPIYI